MNEVHTLSHSTWNCKYHIIFALELPKPEEDTESDISDPFTGSK